VGEMSLREVECKPRDRAFLELGHYFTNIKILLPKHVTSTTGKLLNLPLPQCITWK
jgi:hypothetical protein